MDYAELKKLLEENPTLMAEIKKDIIKADELETILKDDVEGKKVYDKIVNQGIESFKEKGMKTILEKQKETLRNQFYKEFAQEQGIELDPRVKSIETELAEMKAKYADIERKERISKTKSTITSELAKRKLDTGLADFFNLDDETKAIEQLDALSGMVTKSVEESVKAKLKEGNYKPNSGNDNTNTDINPFSKKSFNLTEQSKLFKENPEKAKQLQEMAKNE